MTNALLSLATVKKRLGSTEPLDVTDISTKYDNEEGLPHVAFSLTDDWAVGLDSKAGTEVVAATLQFFTHADEGAVDDPPPYVLTKDSLLEATSLIGLTKQYVARTPAHLIETHLDWWYEAGTKAYRVLIRDDVVLAFTKGGIDPFSNLDVLDAILDQLSDGTKLADWKMQHDLRHTAVRIVSSQKWGLLDEEVWLGGVQLKNSVTGESPLQLKGYLMRESDQAGLISTHATSGAWNRRKGGQDIEKVKDWVRAATDEIVKGLNHEFSALEDLRKMDDFSPDAEDPDKLTMTQALHDVFDQYSVPVEARELVIKNAAETDDDSPFGLMLAVSRAANAPTRETIRTTLMEVAGDLPRANAQRCAKCRRIMT